MSRTYSHRAKADARPLRDRKHAGGIRRRPIVDPTPKGAKR